MAKETKENCPKAPKGEHSWGGHHHPKYTHAYKCNLCDADGHFDEASGRIVEGEAKAKA